MQSIANLYREVLMKIWSKQSHFKLDKWEKKTKITKNTNEFIRRFFIKQAESNNKHHKEKFKQKKDISMLPP